MWWYIFFQFLDTNILQICLLLYILKNCMGLERRSSGKNRCCSGGYLGSVPRSTSARGLSSPALLPGALTLCPTPRATKQMLVEHSAFLHPVDLLNTTSSKPIPMPKCQIQVPWHIIPGNWQWPHLSGSQNKFLPGNSATSLAEEVERVPNTRGLGRTTKKTKLQDLELQ